MKNLLIFLSLVLCFHSSWSADESANEAQESPAAHQESSPAADTDGDGIANIDFNLADIPQVPNPLDDDPMGIREAIRQGENESSNCTREPRLCDLSVYRVNLESRQRCGRGFRVFNLTENAQINCLKIKELEPFRSTRQHPSLKALVSGRGSANTLGKGCGICIRTNLLNGD